MIMKSHILNRLLPSAVRTFLRQCAVETIPSMRHLDMPKRLRHLSMLGMEPKVIFDIGAAQGKWTRLAASIWPHARIIGFEPNRVNVTHLEQTRHDLRQFEYIPCFLGTRRGVIQYEYKGNQTSLYGAPASDGPRDTADMLVLDELIAENRIPPPDFLKLDVQGYELEVLRGGDEAMKGCDAILLEVSFYRDHPSMPTVHDVIEFMAARSFRWFDVMGILRQPENDMLWQLDLHFLKSTHPWWKSH
jgi:FkbM family methyltransferase